MIVPSFSSSARWRSSVFLIVASVRHAPFPRRSSVDRDGRLVRRVPGM
jgi:hypothetical protein